MIGHSKWANIKHTKALKDGQKAAIFKKYSNAIRLAMQEGQSNNPALNSQLRTVMDEALRKNMPMATITNALKKYNANAAQLKKMYLEMKAFNKIFMVGELFHENPAGQKMNIATVLKKANGSYGEFSHMFHDVGLIQVTKPDGTFTSLAEFEEKCTDDAIECSAEDVEDIDLENKSATFICRPIEIEKTKRALSGLGYCIENAEHVFIPNSPIQLTADEEKSYAFLKEKLSQIDGFENIYDNVDIVEEKS
ncbi:unnamed protein product [Diamesa serratosioi]